MCLLKKQNKKNRRTITTITKQKSGPKILSTNISTLFFHHGHFVACPGVSKLVHSASACVLKCQDVI